MACPLDWTFEYGGKHWFYFGHLKDIYGDDALISGIPIDDCPVKCVEGHLAIDVESHYDKLLLEAAKYYKGIHDEVETQYSGILREIEERKMLNGYGVIL